MSAPLDPDEMASWVSSLWPKSKRPRSVIAGVNDDDCAVIKWDSNWLVATTDFINANPIAIELGIGTLRDLGRLLVAANLSDLCGSGAKPFALLVGVTLPHGSTESDYRKVMRGVKIEADRHKVTVVGGDSKLGSARALIAAAFGSAKSRSSLFLKNGARPGDILWASGHLGSAAAAVWGLKRGEFSQRWKRWARTSLLIPRLPLIQSQAVSHRCFGHGGTDVSDGLGVDLSEMCKASEVGAILDAESIPLMTGVRQAARVAGVPPWKFAFASGGDFQFIVSTSKRVRLAMSKLGFFEIGKITKETSLTLRVSDDISIPMPSKGHRDSRRISFADEIANLITQD